MDLEAEYPRFTIPTAILLITAVFLAVVVLANWFDLHASSRPVSNSAGNPA